MMLVLTKAVRILATSSGSIRRSAVAPTAGSGLSFTRRRDAEALRLPGFSLPFQGDTTAWDIRGQYREVLRKRVTGRARCETSGARNVRAGRAVSSTAIRGPPPRSPTPI